MDRSKFKQLLTIAYSIRVLLFLRVSHPRIFSVSFGDYELKNIVQSQCFPGYEETFIKVPRPWKYFAALEGWISLPKNDICGAIK